MFSAVPAAKLTLAAPAADTYGAYSTYATLALGSALALFLYPHSLTAILSSSSPGAIRRNAALLPAYSLVLGLLALLGFMAVALHVGTDPAFADGFKRYGNNFAVPALILSVFPGWFAGVAFAAIAIGALVPSAIMSIACANIVSRNLYRGFIAPYATDAQESPVAKIASLVVKVGALVFIIFVPVPYALAVPVAGRAVDDSGAAVGDLGAVSSDAEWVGVAGRVGGGHRPGNLDGVHNVIQGGGVHSVIRGHQFPRLHRAVVAGGEHRDLGGAVAAVEAVRRSGAYTGRLEGLAAGGWPTADRQAGTVYEWLQMGP